MEIVHFLTLFNPCMKFKTLGGQLYSFEVNNNCPLYKKNHKVLLATSSEGKWINRKSKKECMQFQKLFFVLELYKFLGCLECISRNGLSTAKRA